MLKLPTQTSEAMLLFEKCLRSYQYSTLVFSPACFALLCVLFKRERQLKSKWVWQQPMPALIFVSW